MPVNRNDLEWKATCKVYPAIADLQAISGFVRVEQVRDNINADPYSHDIYNVPAGKIFILGLIRVWCVQADPTAVSFILRTNPVDYEWYAAAYGGAGEVHSSSLNLVFDETEILRITWIGGLAATDVRGLLFGQLFTKY